ncbi:MAG: 3D domain-containing protein [Terrisporobacter sp.]|uniref:3D domain-containing protein n=1 Tax=Terrisporobacter sp. TaxID=1965305 RepID=UPI002FC5812D
MKLKKKCKEKNLLIRFMCLSLSLCIVLVGYWTIKKEEVKLTVKGKETVVDSYKKTVKDLLEENNIVYDEDDIISPKLDTKLNDYMDVKITYVQQCMVSEHERIDYKRKTVKDNTLAKGVEVVTTSGKAGRKTIVYEEIYHDDKLISKTVEKEMIREKPVDKVVTKGTSTSDYAKTTVAKSSDKLLSTSSYSDNGSRMMVSATAYSGDTITATGTRPRWGTIAVDPRIIPYGTKVYIPKFNMTFVAEDCGGGIKGNRIDIFMGSESQCYNWGVRSIDIYVLG